MLWVDPPGDILGRIATITIEPKLSEYLIEESIKSLGIYGVNIKLHPKVNAKIKVWVVRE